MTSPQSTFAEDREAIVALSNRYTDAVNHRDWAAYRDCWTEDAVWDLGAPVDQRKDGIDAIMTEVQRAVGAMSLFVQMNHAVTVLEIHGDTAQARATLNEIAKIRPDQLDLLGGAESFFILALYHDEVRRCADSQWRFSRRTYQVVLFDPSPITGTVQPVQTPGAHTP